MIIGWMLDSPIATNEGLIDLITSVWGRIRIFEGKTSGIDVGHFEGFWKFFGFTLERELTWSIETLNHPTPFISVPESRSWIEVAYLCQWELEHWRGQKTSCIMSKWRRHGVSRCTGSLISEGETFKSVRMCPTNDPSWCRVHIQVVTCKYSRQNTLALFSQSQHPSPIEGNMTHNF